VVGLSPAILRCIAVTIAAAAAACAPRHAEVASDPTPSIEPRLSDDVVILDPAPEPSPAVAELVACEVHEDCVVAQMGCCEGEWVVSVARSSQEEADRRWAKKCPRGRRCFQPAAPGWVEKAVCDRGACARIEDQVIARPDGSWASRFVLVPTAEPPWGSRTPGDAQVRTIPYPR
jgi:hypothetical protein